MLQMAAMREASLIPFQTLPGVGDRAMSRKWTEAVAQYSRSLGLTYSDRAAMCRRNASWQSSGSCCRHQRAKRSR